MITETKETQNIKNYTNPMFKYNENKKHWKKK